MAKDRQNIRGQIVGSNGQVHNIDARLAYLKDNKYFAAAVMCGHAGNGHFVPIIFNIAAKDVDSAIDIIKASPRVKNNAQKCILGIGEISLCEYDFINFINNYDPFLIKKEPPNDKRKVLMPSYADVLSKYNYGKSLTNQEKEILEKILDNPYKYSEDYPDFYILQKTFAPSLIGDRIVYPKKVNMDALLYEYYKNRIEFLGIKNKKPFALARCIQIFGFENEFGIRLDSSNNTIYFTNKYGKNESIKITKKSTESILSHEDFRLRNALKKSQRQTSIEPLPEIETTIKLTSAIDKFNRRLEKSKQAQAENKKQENDNDQERED